MSFSERNPDRRQFSLLVSRSVLLLYLPIFFFLALPCINLLVLSYFSYVRRKLLLFLIPCSLYLLQTGIPAALFSYLIEPLVPSTIYFCAKMKIRIGGMIMITVIQSIGMICVSCTPLKEASPSASVYLLLSCKKINGPR